MLRNPLEEPFPGPGIGNFDGQTAVPSIGNWHPCRRVGIEPAYLSKIERGEAAPPGEETIVRLTGDLGEDRDVMLALAGKVSSDLREIIKTRPRLFAELLRELKQAPENALLRIIREVRDGNW